MPIYAGPSKIGDISAGAGKIKEAYVGSQKVYSSAPPLPPVNAVLSNAGPVDYFGSTYYGHANFIGGLQNNLTPPNFIVGGTNRTFSQLTAHRNQSNEPFFTLVSVSDTNLITVDISLWITGDDIVTVRHTGTQSLNDQLWYVPSPASDEIVNFVFANGGAQINVSVVQV